MFDIMGAITKAETLFNEATAIYNTLSGEVKDATGALKHQTLEEARARLQGSIERATTAHDSLDAAIAARLGE